MKNHYSVASAFIGQVRKKHPILRILQVFNFLTAITFKFILLRFRDAMQSGKRVTEIGVTGCLQKMANLYQSAGFGVLETNYADGQTDTTSLHVSTL